MKTKLVSKVVLGVAAVLLTFGVSTVIHADTTQNVTIKTQQDLNSYLNNVGADFSGDSVTFSNDVTLTFPPNKTYFIKSSNLLWNIPSNSGADIDLNGSSIIIDSKPSFQVRVSNGGSEANRKLIKNGNVIGSASDGKGGNFYLTALKAHDFGIFNMNFYNSHKMGSHLFDLAGTSNFDFNNLGVYGYGTSGSTVDSLSVLANADAHLVYAEAIQVDSAYKDAFGTNALSTNSYAIYKEITVPSNINDKNANVTQKVSLRNSKFAPYDGVTGHGLIVNNNNLKSNQKFSSIAIGQHSGNKVASASITNNIFDSTVYTTIKDDNGQLYNDKRFYPIHFRNVEKTTIFQKNNEFINQHGCAKSNGYAGAGLYVAYYK